MTTPTRRERNKTRTRLALLDATRELSAQHGLDHVTAEQISEHAGVSRRTFFNYFPTIEAALVEATVDELDAPAETFLSRPAHEDPLTALINALSEQPIGDRLLGWVAAVAVEGDELPARHRSLWQDHRANIASLLEQRLGAAADPLVTIGLAGAVMAIFEAAEKVWVQTLGPVPITDDDVDRFNDLLIRGLRQAQAGWAGEPTPH